MPLVERPISQVHRGAAGRWWASIDRKCGRWAFHCGSQCLRGAVIGPQPSCWTRRVRLTPSTSPDSNTSSFNNKSKFYLEEAEKLLPYPRVADKINDIAPIGGHSLLWHEVQTLCHILLFVFLQNKVVGRQNGFVSGPSCRKIRSRRRKGCHQLNETDVFWWDNALNWKGRSLQPCCHAPFLLMKQLSSMEPISITPDIPRFYVLSFGIIHCSVLTIDGATRFSYLSSKLQEAVLTWQSTS